MISIGIKKDRARAHVTQALIEMIYTCFGSLVLESKVLGEAICDPHEDKGKGNTEKFGAKSHESEFSI